LNVKKLFDLSEKTIVITGAAGLLGSQYSEGLAQAGANLVLTDINYHKCTKIAKSLKKKYKVKILPVKVDVASKKSIQSMVKKTLRNFSKIDVLINNAINSEELKDRIIPLEKFSLSQWNKIISTNLTGTFLCCQEVGPVMLNQKKGVIINVSSIYGMVAADQRIYGKSKQNSTIAYGTSKSAILNFTRYLASYWRNTGIRVNTLSLGGVKNKQDPHFIKKYSYKTMMGRMAKKEEYIGAIIFLSSEASSYMNGANLVVDGGWTAW